MSIQVMFVVDGTVLETEAGALSPMTPPYEIWEHKTTKGALLLINTVTGTPLLQFKLGWNIWQKPDGHLVLSNWAPRSDQLSAA